MIDKVVESVEFLLGVRRIKAACMVADVEIGKQVVREKVASGRSDPGESSAIVDLNQEMHASVKAFFGDGLRFVSPIR